MGLVTFDGVNDALPSEIASEHGDGTRSLARRRSASGSRVGSASPKKRGARADTRRLLSPYLEDWAGDAPRRWVVRLLGLRDRAAGRRAFAFNVAGCVRGCVGASPCAVQAEDRRHARRP